MKAVILAGGLGTRLSEETAIRPKPMVEVGGKPILVHVMEIYSQFDCNEFVICLGYKGHLIKEYFANYSIHNSDITFDFRSGEMTVHSDRSKDWKVTLVDTGQGTMTGGRIRRVKDFIGSDVDFFMTYGDGVSDVNISELLKCHRKSGKIATVTAVKPPGRFGALRIEDNVVTEFVEKPVGEQGFINGGFFVLSNKIFDFLASDETIFEQEPMRTLAITGELAAFRHEGFWHPMDTLRDKQLLENLWENGDAPWASKK